MTFWRNKNNDMLETLSHTSWYAPSSFDNPVFLDITDFNGEFYTIGWTPIAGELSSRAIFAGGY